MVRFNPTTAGSFSGNISIVSNGGNVSSVLMGAGASDITPLADIECLLNWAQTYYPNLFSPLVTGLQFFSPYTYRYYKGTNAYVGVSSTDNNVYYLRSDGVLQEVGDLYAWLTTAGCPKE